jgi:hypothetical protein
LAAIGYRGLAYQPELWHWWQVQTQTEPLIDDLFANKQIAPERLAQQNLPDFARVLQKTLQSNPNKLMVGIC